MQRYNVHWVNMNHRQLGEVQQSIVDKPSLGIFIVSLTNDDCIITQVTPVGEFV